MGWVIVPDWYSNRRGLYLGLLSFVGQASLAVVYTGQAFEQERLPYLALGLLCTAGLVMLGVGMRKKSWRWLRRGSGIGAAAWVVFGAQLILPEVFQFTILPLHVRIALLLVGGCAGFQTWFLYQSSGLELARGRT